MSRAPNQEALLKAARAFVDHHLKGQPRTPGTLYPMTYATQDAWFAEWENRLGTLITAVDIERDAEEEAEVMRGDQIGLEESREQFHGTPHRPTDDTFIVVREWHSRHPTKRHTLGDKVHRLSVGPFATTTQARAYLRRAKRSDVYSVDSEFHVVRMRRPVDEEPAVTP